MNKQYSNIVIAGDHDAYIPICALLNSIILNCNNYKQLKIYIVCESAIELNKLINVNCYINELEINKRLDLTSNSIIKLIEPPTYIINEIIEKQSFISNGVDHLKKTKDWSKPISIYNFIRFYFPKLLPNYVNKVIYLDTDMIVKCDIEELFNLFEPKYDLGAVFSKFPYILEKKNWINPSYISLLSRNNLFNAGMYVTYMNKWRENNYLYQCMSLIESNKVNNIYNGGTQVPMNVIFSGSTQELPQEWNQTGLGERTRPVSQIFEEHINNAKILHWTGQGKPWLSNKNNLYPSFAEEWYIYFNKSNEDLSLLNNNNKEFISKIVKLQNEVNNKVQNFNLISSNLVQKYDNIIFITHGNRCSDKLRAKHIQTQHKDIKIISLYHEGTENKKENVLQELQTYKNSIFIWVFIIDLEFLTVLKSSNIHIFDTVDSYCYNKNTINNILNNNLLDGIIVNNMYMKNYFHNKFSGEIYIIPHHYDPTLETATLVNQDKLTFGYMGDIHSLQHTSNFVNYYNLLDDYHIEFLSTTQNIYLTDIIRNITENKGDKYYKVIWITPDRATFKYINDNNNYILRRREENALYINNDSYTNQFEKEIIGSVPGQRLKNSITTIPMPDIIPENSIFKNYNANNINNCNNFTLPAFDTSRNEYEVWKPKNKKYEIIKSPAGIFNLPTNIKNILTNNSLTKNLSNLNIKFNCHISIREIDSELFKFKTSAKIATAAYFNHNIITTYEESIKDIMPEDYPFILYSTDTESIKKMFNIVINDFNGDKNLWNKGLKIMKKIKEDLSIETISKKYLEIFQ
jgi:lipopolysaccharide biosynthesis glycosyltransferase